MPPYRASRKIARLQALSRRLLPIGLTSAWQLQPFFSFCAPARHEEATDGVGAAGSSGFQCRCLGLHFVFVVAFSSEVKSWRLFMIADAWARSVRPWRPRSR